MIHFYPKFTVSLTCLISTRIDFVQTIWPLFHTYLPPTSTLHQKISLPYYYSWRKEIWIHTFPWVLAKCEMQTALSRIRTQINLSISIDNIYYNTCVSDVCFVGLEYAYLHSLQWITFPTQSWLFFFFLCVFYSLWASLPYSLILRVIVSSLVLLAIFWSLIYPGFYDMILGCYQQQFSFFEVAFSEATPMSSHAQFPKSPCCFPPYFSVLGFITFIIITIIIIIYKQASWKFQRPWQLR